MQRACDENYSVPQCGIGGVITHRGRGGGFELKIFLVGNKFVLPLIFSFLFFFLGGEEGGTYFPWCNF